MLEKRLAIIISSASLLALVARSLWPSLFNIDAIALGLIVLAALPWLSHLIKSIEIPGVGKIELQELKKSADDAKGAAHSAANKAELALASSSTIRNATTSKEIISDSPSSVAQLTELIEEYNNIRQTQKSGSARTSAMTSVVSRMVSLVTHLAEYDIDQALLDGSNAGKRLAAYSWLYAKPNYEKIDILIDSITRIENKPFGQYWGILALGKVLGIIEGSKINPENLNKLNSLYSKLLPGTDRQYELGQILKGLRSPRDVSDRVKHESENRLASGKWERALNWKKSSKYKH